MSRLPHLLLPVLLCLTGCLTGCRTAAPPEASPRASSPVGTAIYDVKDFDHPEERQLSGRELMEKGLRIEILKQPGAVVFHYKKVE